MVPSLAPSSGEPRNEAREEPSDALTNLVRSVSGMFTLIIDRMSLRRENRRFVYQQHAQGLLIFTLSINKQNSIRCRRKP